MLPRDRVVAGYNLKRKLHRALWAWWAMALRRWLLLGLIGVGITTLVAWLGAWLTGAAGPLMGGGTPLLTWPPRSLLIVFSAVLVLGLVSTLVRSPTLLELARRADRQLGTSQRLSTAWEVLERGAPDSVITGSLIDEVEGLSAGLDLRPVERSGGYGWLPYIALVAVAASALAATVPVPNRPVPSSGVLALESSSPVLSTADIETLKHTARLLELVAERQDSPYLRALAASFDELGRSWETGTVSMGDADRTLEELTQHLLTAATEVGGAFGKAVGDAMADQRTGGQASLQQAVEDVAESGLVPKGAVADAPPPAKESSTELQLRALSALVEQFEADPSALGLPPRPARGDQPSDMDLYGGVLNAAMDTDAAPPEGPAGARVEGRGGGDAAGAAERSSDRAGDAAGAGVADLGPGSDEFLGLEAESSVATLPRNEVEGGRLVEIGLVPAESEGALQHAANTPSRPAFSRADEAAFATRGVGTAYRQVVGRYFTPDAVSTQARP